MPAVDERLQGIGSKLGCMANRCSCFWPSPCAACSQTGNNAQAQCADAHTAVACPSWNNQRTDTRLYPAKAPVYMSRISVSLSTQKGDPDVPDTFLCPVWTRARSTAGMHTCCRGGLVAPHDAEVQLGYPGRPRQLVACALLGSDIWLAGSLCCAWLCCRSDLRDRLHKLCCLSFSCRLLNHLICRLLLFCGGLCRSCCLQFNVVQARKAGPETNSLPTMLSGFQLKNGIMKILSNVALLAEMPMAGWTL